MWKKDIKYDQIVDILNEIPQYMPLSGVERAKELLSELGNPQDQLKIIHVAGTNGKGSVSAYLNQILMAHGYKVGLFTSPHLVDPRERIRINLKMIPKEGMEQVWNRVVDAVYRLQNKGIELAYFDYFLGMALCWFQEEKVDYVVMETGLGGRLDATNAVAHPIACVITTISLEHTAILGDTLSAIATEKAGIIKPGIPVIYSNKHTEIEDAIEKKANAVGARTFSVCPKDYQIQKNTGNVIDFSLQYGYYKNDCFTITTPAVYQVENCCVALVTAMVLNMGGQADLQQDRIKKAVYHIQWEGRMEEVLPDIYVDGAHNPEGIEALILSAEELCRGKQCTLLFSVVKDKNFEMMIRRLCECGLFQRYIVTQVGGSRQLEGESIRQVFERFTEVPVEEFDDTRDAFTYGLQHKADVMICAGSLYLVGELKEVIQKTIIS